MVHFRPDFRGKVRHTSTGLLDSLAVLIAASPRLRLVGSATTSHEAILLTRRLHPDVVLADIRMPGPDGIELTRALTAGDRRGRPRVLVTTAFPLDAYLLAALGGGAAGLLTKDAPWAQLEAALVDVHHDRIALPADLSARLVGLTLPGQAGIDKLTKRELEVLALVGDGQAPSDIAAALNLSPGTIRAHLEHLRYKLDAPDRASLALASRRAGLSPKPAATDPSTPP